MNLYSEQLRLEEDALYKSQLKIDNDFSKAIQQGRFDETFQGSSILKVFFHPLREKVEEAMTTPLKGHAHKNQKYLDYLCNGNYDILTYIGMQLILQRVTKANNSFKITTLSSHIIKQLKIVNAELLAKENNPKLMSYLGAEFRRASARRKRELIQKHLAEFMIKRSNTAEDIRAGAFLIDVFDKASLDFIVIHKQWVHKGGKVSHPTFYVSLGKSIMEVISKEIRVDISKGVYLPMVYPPRDWVNFNEGGYLSLNFTFMKAKTRAHSSVCKTTDLSNAFRAINKLQKVGWRINTRILDIIKYVYTNNLIDPSSPKELPRLYGELPTSKVLDVYDIVGEFPYKKEYDPAKHKKEYHLWNKKRESVKIGLDGEIGRRLLLIQAISRADVMKKYDVFYYPYQLDYRGRVYPIPDFLNPQSKGYIKSLLEFSEGKVLDDRGLYWLKIHTANCYGLDKAPFEERVRWFEENRLSIIVTANDPMSKVSYWNEADSPYEFIACCLAYKDHIEGKEVHLPIQLDAVNSGTQVYSGLLRDKEGAEATCVIGKDRADLYQIVADKVNEYLEKGEYEKYVGFIDKTGKDRLVSTKIEADSLRGKVTRSMVKRNTMTLSYSVTRQGMKDQNWDTMHTYQLEGKDFWKGDPWVVNYLWTELTYKALEEIVKAARLGQDFFKQAVKGNAEPALWHTPIYNIPVYQDFYRYKEHRVKTVVGSLLIKHRTDKVNRAKQGSSIAANFIHSIDATLLMYIADKISCNLGVIHDCFLVHPNDGDEVRNLYKEGFVRIMKLDPLYQFKKEVADEKDLEIPYVNDLELDEVYDSEYIIS